MNYLGTVSENDLVDYEYNNRKNKIRRTCPMRHENGKMGTVPIVEPKSLQ